MEIYIYIYITDGSLILCLLVPTTVDNVIVVSNIERAEESFEKTRRLRPVSVPILEILSPENLTP